MPFAVAPEVKTVFKTPDCLKLPVTQLPSLPVVESMEYSK